METEKRTRIGTRRTTLAVLEILKTSTSRSNPISISELVKRLNAEYDISTHRDSVAAILSDLMMYYPKPDRICCSKSNSGRTYQSNYYYQTELPEALQENIQKIDQVMRKNRDSHKQEYRISFDFCGYGSDHEVHPVSRQYHILPARIVQAYGYYYLIGFWPGSWDTAHFHIDLMRRITVEEFPRSNEEQRQFNFNKVMAKDYLSSHLYMFYERNDTPKRIHLQVKKDRRKPNASLFFLQDTFGDNWDPVSGTETEEQIEVQVTCLPSAIKLFVRRYIDQVRVLGPEDVVEQVEQDLREKFAEYFGSIIFLVGLK